MIVAVTDGACEAGTYDGLSWLCEAPFLKTGRFYFLAVFSTILLPVVTLLVLARRDFGCDDFTFSDGTLLSGFGLLRDELISTRLAV